MQQWLHERISFLSYMYSARFLKNMSFKSGPKWCSFLQVYVNSV